jgi:hypothetical protein
VCSGCSQARAPAVAMQALHCRWHRITPFSRINRPTAVASALPLTSEAIATKQGMPARCAHLAALCGCRTVHSLAGDHEHEQNGERCHSCWRSRRHGALTLAARCCRPPDTVSDMTPQWAYQHANFATSSLSCHIMLIRALCTSAWCAI